MNAKQLVESVVEGAKPSVALSESMNGYDYGYKTADLQTSISRNLAESRTMLKQCQSYPKQKDPNKQKMKAVLEKQFSTIVSNLESAETAVMKAHQAVESYKDAPMDAPKSY